MGPVDVLTPPQLAPPLLFLEVYILVLAIHQPA
jgi:hypothetical protein